MKTVSVSKNDPVNDSHKSMQKIPVDGAVEVAFAPNGFFALIVERSAEILILYR
jgi:hypothetical protein